MTKKTEEKKTKSTVKKVSKPVAKSKAEAVKKPASATKKSVAAPKKTVVKASVLKSTEKHPVFGEEAKLNDKFKVALPRLTAVQRDSYERFLQKDVLPQNRQQDGLQQLFTKAFPILSNNKRLEMDLVHYFFGSAKYSIEECKRRGKTYEVPVKARMRVKGRVGSETIIKEQIVNLGMIPMMTDNGTFIVNGVERVIVSQLQRSPGIYYLDSVHSTGITLYGFTLIPSRGSWLEATLDPKDNIYITVDRRHARRRVRATTFLRALGFERDEDLMSLFYKTGERVISEKNNPKLDGLMLAAAVEQKGEVLVEKCTVLNPEILEELLKLGVERVTVFDAKANSPIIRMIQDENAEYEEKNAGVSEGIRNIKKDALKEIYRRFQPGEVFSQENAERAISRLFFDTQTYDLSDVGRYKFNVKLGLPLSETEMSQVTLREIDLVEAIAYLLAIRAGEKIFTHSLLAQKDAEQKGYKLSDNEPVKLDDIDHLGNRRIRPVGELVANQCRIALARMDKYVRERMSSQPSAQMSVDDVPQPEKLVNPRILTNLMHDFFGRSQLSQFMDQLNPLAELTHKRRLSALGPGGLNRDRAGFKVRDVHNSHYGRICPIETPEGANIGLIASMSTYMQTNKYGFMETPYLLVEKGKVTDKIVYLSAHEEEKYTIAQANALRNADLSI